MFRRLQLKNEPLEPSCDKENTSERESFQSLRSLPAQEAEGLEGLLNYRFWKTIPKEQDFEAYQKQKAACWKEAVPKECALRKLPSMIEVRFFFLI